MTSFTIILIALVTFTALQGTPSSSTYPSERETNLLSQEDQGSVSFYLINSSLTSIPLIIPGVMNPNLSPMSSSGVELAYGQKIFFKVSGTRYLLLQVDENITQGVKVDVGKLLKDRKKELGLK
jgi:hypothetical protein